MNMKEKSFAGIFHFWLVLSFFMTIFIGQQAGAIAAEVYQIDPEHSSLSFAVKHLTVSTVTGQFTDYRGMIQYDPADPSTFMVDVDIKSSSIDTRQQQRDKHLKSADFFDAEKYPAITFKSKKLSGSTITGDLTMHGVTKEISIPVSISGPVNSPMGGKVIGISAETTINRQDFGISWNKTLDSGGYMVSDEVKIMVNIEAGNKAKEK